MKEQTSAGAREKRMAEDLWLSYFNRYLFEQGLITEQERNRMVAKIAERNRRTPSGTKKAPTEPDL